jgi:hypothetical protein
LIIANMPSKQAKDMNGYEVCCSKGRQGNGQC